MTEVVHIWRPANLEDDIVKLLPLQEQDFEALYQAASDPLIWEQHPTKDRYKKEVFQSYFDEAVASGTAFVVVDKASQNIIGSTRYYDYNPERSSIAIGYTFLTRAYWGGHYNRSTKKLLIDYAFRFVKNVLFHIGTQNLRSQIATSKIGAKKVGEVYLDHYGKKLLHFEYLIQKHEWVK